jgi:hypothetical protein
VVVSALAGPGAVRIGLIKAPGVDGGIVVEELWVGLHGWDFLLKKACESQRCGPIGISG